MNVTNRLGHRIEVKEVECPECNGRGGFEYDCTDSSYEHTTRGEACECCDSAFGEIDVCIACEERPSYCRCEPAKAVA